MTFSTYILRCADGTLYTGYARDLDARVATHNAGKGAVYTRGRLPVTLVWFEPFQEQGDAMRREMQIKRWSRARKEALLRGT